MKKTFIGASMALLVLGASCSKDNTTAADDQKFTVAAEQSDSISTLYGKATGFYVLSDFQRFGEEHQTDKVKEDILKGIRQVFANANEDGEIMGLQIGLQLIQELRQFEEQGIAVDRQEVLRNFAEVFTADSIDITNHQKINGELTALLGRIQEQQRKHQLDEAAQAPEAQQNLISGKAFLDKVVKEDADVKVSESGLGYKIIEAGTPAEIKDNTVMKVNYKGSLIDGKVFDQSPEGQPVAFSPASVIPGFAEGLKMLGKGGKATFYIPGNLAYGPQGIPQAGIGPNQMLVFDVEIVDIVNQ